MGKIKDSENHRAWFCLKMALDNISSAQCHLKAQAIDNPLNEELELCKQALLKIQKRTLHD